MNVLVLAEGDPADPNSSSGTPGSILRHLRRAGAEAVGADVDLHGPARVLAAAATFAPGRRRWRVKYHLGPLPFALRSRNATRLAGRAGTEAVLQYGATFHTRLAPHQALFLYCDSTVRLSIGDPQAWSASLRPRELEGAVARERAVYEAAAMIFTLSDCVRRSFLDHLGLPPEKVLTVYAGANLEPDSVAVPAPAGEAPTVLFVGREFERKGGDVLLQAFRTVREAMPQARLIIAGPERLPRLDPGVEFLGYLPRRDAEAGGRLARAFASAHVFCLPTRFEPFGIVIVEAMLQGLPVVATRVWAVPELVVDGETGFTVPRDDADALADRLVRLLRDPALARRMGAAGRARAETRFTWGHGVAKMTEAMERTLRDGRPRTAGGQV